MKLKWAVLLMMAAGLSSCAFLRLAFSHLKKPTFAYVRCDVKDIREEKAEVEIVLSSYNPNEVGLKNVWVSYELFNRNQRFLKGDSIRIDLAPKDTTQIVIPVEIIYKDAFKVLGPMAERVLLEKKTIPVRIDAVITGNPTLYNDKEEGSLISFTLKVSRTEDIPVPEAQINGIKNRLQRAVQKMF